MPITEQEDRRVAWLRAEEVLGLEPGGEAVTGTPSASTALFGDRTWKATPKSANLPINVKDADYGAVGDGVTDDTAAITAADTVACAGTLGLDGVTVVAERALYFPGGSYRTDGGLVYRGAPWFGDGPNATKLVMYGSAGPCVNAEGVNGARKLLNIRDMMLDGQNATGSAHGLRLGYNQRSMRALDNVRISFFPGPGMYFKTPTWIMAFRDVYLSFNAADNTGTGVYVDSGTATDVLAIDWYDIVLENNGFIGSGVPGGLVTFAGCQGWRFFGGTIEGNYGAAEAQFTDTSGVHLYGTYFEADPGSVLAGVVFDGTSMGSMHGVYLGRGSGGAANNGLVVKNTANVTVDQLRSNDRWTYDIELQNTATVNLVGDGVELTAISVAAGASLKRSIDKPVTLTDAATIAVDAAMGTAFSVVLGGNRTMGTPTNPSVGQLITLLVYQDGTGGRTLAFSAAWAVSWSDTGNAAGLSSGIQFKYDGALWVQISAQSPYV